MAQHKDYRLDDQIGYILRRVTQRHLALFAAAIPEVTTTQFAVLARLAEIGPVSQNHLGRETAMDAATIKGVVDRLAKLGLVATTADPADRRRLTVSLTGAQLQQVVGFDEVLWAEAWTPPGEDVDNARIQGGANYIETAGGYSGQGVNVHIYEGLEATHYDFTGGVTNVLSGGGADTHGHATAGIVFGNGTSNPAVRGMAPNCSKFFTQYSSVTAGYSRWQVIDVLVCDGVVHSQEPDVKVYDVLTHGLLHKIPDPERELDRVAFQPTVRYLGRGLERFRCLHAPRYQEMLSYICERRGWNPASFHGYRVEIEYPPYSWQTVLTLRLPPRP